MNVNFTKTSAASFGFGSSKRPAIGVKSTINVPGPGNYTIPDRIGNEGSKITLGMRTLDLSDAKRNISPGPGNYEIGYGANISTVKKEPAFSMGTGQRQDISKAPNSNVPGPGNYNTIDSDTKSKSP